MRPGPKSHDAHSGRRSETIADLTDQAEWSSRAAERRAVVPTDRAVENPVSPRARLEGFA